MKKKGIVRRSECIWHLGTQDNYWHGMFLLRGHTECSRFAREDIDFSIPISDRNTSDSMDAGLFALAWKQETGLPAPLLLVWSRLQLQVAHTFVQVVATTTRYSRTTWYWDYWPEFRFKKKDTGQKFSFRVGQHEMTGSSRTRILRWITASASSSWKCPCWPTGSKRN